MRVGNGAPKTAGKHGRCRVSTFNSPRQADAPRASILNPVRLRR